MFLHYFSADTGDHSECSICFSIYVNQEMGCYPFENENVLDLDIKHSIYYLSSGICYDCDFLKFD